METRSRFSEGELLCLWTYGKTEWDLAVSTIKMHKLGPFALDKCDPLMLSAMGIVAFVDIMYSSYQGYSLVMVVIVALYYLSKYLIASSIPMPAEGEPQQCEVRSTGIKVGKRITAWRRWETTMLYAETLNYECHDDLKCKMIAVRYSIVGRPTAALFMVPLHEHGTAANDVINRLNLALSHSVSDRK